jgi:hypothetical protein
LIVPAIPEFAGMDRDNWFVASPEPSAPRREGRGRR